jgi:hypothetical protein
MSNSTDGYNPTAEQQQNMDNLSFDRKYLVNSVENLVEDEAGTKVERMVQPMKESTAKDGSQKTQIVETIPTDTTKLNGSVAITETVDGTVTTKTITKTINGTNYVKTVATDSSDNSVTISSWA